MKYILALDEGTTSARALLYDIKANKIINISKYPVTQFFPKSGWVEQDAEEIWQLIKKAVFDVTADINPKDIAAIGITNQRETVVAWDKRTGKPICKAIVWQCRRTADYCNQIKKTKLKSKIKQKTGLIIDAYFSATKIKWILENVPEATKLLKENNLLVGTIDSYLVYRLTGGKSHVTDVTNASRTMIFNIHDLCWDEGLLKTFKIPAKILPKIVSNSEVVGETNLLGQSIKISGMAGDQQSSLFGQGCFYKNSIKNTYGTGSFVLMNVGTKPIFSKSLITTVAYKVGSKVHYAIEGSVFNAGSTIDWICRELKLINSPNKLTLLALRAKDNNGVFLVPAFTGIGCPYWDMDARAIITGLSRGTNSSHLARAVLESVAYSVNDVISAFEKETKIHLKEINVDGGVIKNDFLMQFQANISGVMVKCSNTESTSLGAIYFAGLGAGIFKSVSELKLKIFKDKIYKPNIGPNEAEYLLEGWKKAVRQCLKK